jgi:hypothetical protein
MVVGKVAGKTGGNFRISSLRWYGWEGGRQNWWNFQNFKLKVMCLRRWQADWRQFQNLKLKVTWLGRWQANWLKHQNVSKFWLWMNVMGIRSHILSRNKRNDKLCDAVVKTIAALPKSHMSCKKKKYDVGCHSFCWPSQCSLCCSNGSYDSVQDSHIVYSHCFSETLWWRPE